MIEDREVRHFHFFCGLGGGAKGFNLGRAEFNEMSEVKLLPCPNPWCASLVAPRYVLSNYRMEVGFSVRCECGLMGPQGSTGTEAAAAWNTRPDAEIKRLMDGGAGLIAAERQRQLTEEGWTADHDDGHTLAQLAIAGLSYASVAASQVRLRNGCIKDRLPTYWPWSDSLWKPSDDPVRNLVKAGALIAAEIDRLQRAALNPPQQKEGQ